MDRLVGYRFHPTDDELITYYLNSKIMGNNTWLVHQAMTEIDFCKFDPWDLHLQSKISSNDPVWYFFSPRDNPNPKKKGTKRTTNSGFWKATGVDRKIKRKGGSGEIGVKKTLVFYSGRVPNGSRTPYVMHEYHSSVLSPGQNTYVICKVKFKGDAADAPSGNGSEPSYSLASNLNDIEMSTGSGFNCQGQVQVQGTPESFYGITENDLVMPLNDQTGLSLWEVQNLEKFGGNPNVELQTPYWNQNENESNYSLMNLNQEDWKYLFDDDTEQAMYKHVQEDHNDYRPQEALTGVCVDSSSDSDAESVSAKSYQETSSPVDTVGSSNGNHQTDLDDDVHVEEMLSSLDHKELVATTTSEKAGPSRPQRRYNNGPIRFQLPSKQEVKKVKERASVAAVPREMTVWKVAQDTNKAASVVVAREKKGWFIWHDAIEKRREHPPPYVYLVNMVVGIFLLVSLLYAIISVS
ncbi:PREDICTED: NAC domain-containing protein 69-like isoform X2 [Tarenaya hassleriana]|uniref:NAC domain-containing protein 69-like isoform X2 n=1 Tax=Tarenaya hassleriana TaxID=28532 RepID=UPI00053C87FD|nr:PREDICTED: NAC domain-containing protein 69-like isoform X2 [Tarenaya hassleriana]